MSGSESVPTTCVNSHLCGNAGLYGTKGQPSAQNAPGGRTGSIRWTDSQGNLWLFGGFGADSAGVAGELNDMWEFNTLSSQWVWQGGATTVPTQCAANASGGFCGNSGNYGTQGVFAMANAPGGRDGGVSWTDSKGNLWLFGGEGFDSSGNFGWLNDLWQFNPNLNQWAWMGGANSNGSACKFWAATGETICTQPSTAESPGGRISAMSWTDGEGNFWLFGGVEVDSSGNFCGLDDLWKFNPLTEQWSAQGGATAANPNQLAIPAVYGVPRKLQSGQTPGGRWNGRTWTDSFGDLWLFGGANSFASIVGDPSPLLNDIWKFSPQSGQWAWMGGTQGAAFGLYGSEGVYGELATPAVTNVPGGRVNEVNWKDSEGNFWLGGGFGQGAGPTEEDGLNDLWAYSPTANEWTWMGGSSQTFTPQSSPPGVYGTVGVPASGNLPGTREFATSWTDTNGNFWLFGGEGVDSSGKLGYLNDLWKYAPPTAPTPVPGFMFYAPLPGSNTTTYPGGNVSYKFYTFTGGGFNSPIVLSASGLPSDATANFNPNPINGAGLFQLGVALGANSSPGDYNIMVTGTGGGITQTALTSMLVQPPFFVVPAANTIDVQYGTQATMAVTVSVEAGFNSPVTLAASGQPSGVSVSFAPVSISVGQSSSMTVNVGSSILPGTYSFMITGAANGVTEQSQVSLVVTAGPPPTFTLAASPTSFSVPADSQGATTLTFTPQNGFTGQVNLTCSCTAIPPHSSYALAPFVTVSGTPVTTPFTVFSFSQSAATRNHGHPFILGTSMAFALCFASRIRRKSWWTALLIPLALCSLGSISSCGGGGGGTVAGGSGGGTGGGSNPVSFKVTVTATSGSIQQSTVISVTLN